MLLLFCFTFVSMSGPRYFELQPGFHEYFKIGLVISCNICISNLNQRDLITNNISDLNFVIGNKTWNNYFIQFLKNHLMRMSFLPISDQIVVQHYFSYIFSSHKFKVKFLSSRTQTTLYLIWLHLPINDCRFTFLFLNSLSVIMFRDMKYISLLSSFGKYCLWLLLIVAKLCNSSYYYSFICWTFFEEDHYLRILSCL